MGDIIFGYLLKVLPSFSTILLFFLLCALFSDPMGRHSEIFPVQISCASLKFPLRFGIH